MNEYIPYCTEHLTACNKDACFSPIAVQWRYYTALWHYKNVSAIWF